VAVASTLITSLLANWTAPQSFNFTKAGLLRLLALAGPIALKAVLLYLKQSPITPSSNSRGPGPGLGIVQPINTSVGQSSPTIPGGNMKSFSIAAIILLAIALTASPALAQSQPKQTSNLAKVGKVASYPVVHPVKTLQGTVYGFFVAIGAGVDVVEKVTGTVASGAKKLDEGADYVAGETDPSSSGAQARAAKKAKKKSP